jgi:transposase
LTRIPRAWVLQETQITIGLLTSAAGFPLMVHAFEGNEAETTTVVPVIGRSRKLTNSST